MINISNNHMIYIACFVLITIVCIYFLLVWQIKEIVKDELVKEHEKNKDRRKKMLHLKQKRMQQSQSRQNAQHLQQQQQQSQETNNSIGTFDDFNDNMDLDSYIDPAEGYLKKDRNVHVNDDDEPVGYSNSRLDKNDIMTRDIADGIR